MMRIKLYQRDSRVPEEQGDDGDEGGGGEDDLHSLVTSAFL